MGFSSSPGGLQHWLSLYYTKRDRKIDFKLQKHFLNLNPGKSHSPYKSKYVICQTAYS